jgi:hypothetical protein
MPQPIQRECDIALNGLFDLPEHAAALGRVVAVSGYLEALLGHFLAYMTGSAGSVTISMFHAVTSTDGQRAMLAAAAEEILKGSDLEEFRDIMDDFRTRYRERSRIVHNVWGSSGDHPTKAVWCAAKDATRLSTQLVGITDPEQFTLFVSADGALWRKCSLYSVKDIDDVHDRLNAYTERVRQFVLKLQVDHPVLGAQARREVEPSDEQDDEPPPLSLPDQNPA